MRTGPAKISRRVHNAYQQPSKYASKQAQAKQAIAGKARNHRQSKQAHAKQASTSKASEHKQSKEAQSKANEAMHAHIKCSTTYATNLYKPPFHITDPTITYRRSPTPPPNSRASRSNDLKIQPPPPPKKRQNTLRKPSNGLLQRRLCTNKAYILPW